MTNVWCVRAEFGIYAQHFVKGGYVGLGYIYTKDLSAVTSRDQLYELYLAEHPEDTSNIVVGQQVGQLARFLLEMKPGDYIVTPAANTELLYYGKLAEPDSIYYYYQGDDGCPYKHRRPVEWASETLKRSSFSVPFQNTIRSSLTVFAISQKDEFLASIGRKDLASVPESTVYDPYRAVLEAVLELDDKEFEILVGHLLTAVGFEGSEVTGKTGDGGVDAIGELNVANLAKVKVFVQAKRYKLGTKINASTVRQLRQAIPFGGQGAFITTADFQNNAADIAVEPGFSRIGLVNGRQLVDLLVEHWNDIPKEFQDRLGLKPGLVRV
jgi:restriction system protein